MNKRHYEHTLPNIRGSLSNTYAPATFGPDLIMSPRKVSWLFMQGFTIKYYPCGAKGGDFVVNRQSLTLHTRMT